MGKLRNGLFGPFTGTVGNVTGSMWNGINVVKQANREPNIEFTQAQVDQQDKMRYMTKFFSPGNAAVIKPMNDRYVTKNSGWSYNLSKNMDAFDENGVSDYTALRISSGSLLSVDLGTPTNTAGSDQLTVPWTDNSGQSNAKTDDKVFVYAVNDTQQNGGIISGTVDRDEATVDVTLQEDTVSGDVLYIMVGLKSANGRITSNTAVATLTVA